MMTYLFIGSIAFFASILTFFSGFGLGTLLTPVFVLCGFDLEMAIGLTAIVHLLNNLFKFLLVGKYVEWSIILKFGITAIAGAIIGSLFLSWKTLNVHLSSYTLNDSEFQIELIKCLVAIVMIFFSLMEIIPAMNFSVDKKYLPVGGLLSGFFGGLSGHQGALRSSFLMKCRLDKNQFIATGIVIACLIDFSRLSIYWSHFSTTGIQSEWPLLLTATGAAFAGAWIGQKLLRKITVRVLQYTVSILIILFSFALGLGWV